MEIIPWKCHVCGREFETTKGGLCSICNKPTCLVCLGLRGTFVSSLPKRQKDLICISCAKTIKNSDQMKKQQPGISRQLGSIRENIKKIERKAFNKLKNPPDDVA